MRAVDLAVYADLLAGKASSLAARAERLRSALRQAALERSARTALDAEVVERLERMGLLHVVDERRLHAELRELDGLLAALSELQAWTERELERVSAA